MPPYGLVLFIHSLIHSFHNYLETIYHVPGAMLGIGSAIMNKTTVPVPIKFKPRGSRY